MMIEMENLRKSYGDYELNLSLHVPMGTVTGLVGKNGAGKSTTMKAILGLICPDSGMVKVFGKDAGRLTGVDKQNLGVAFSNSCFSEMLHVENVIGILRKLYQPFNEKRFREICEEQKLPFKKPIKEFSTGMRAKLRVLIAMCHEAKLLILDEPTSGLDVIARNEILDMLREYLEADNERSILISSHISSDLEGLCDDIYMIHEGKLLLHEDTDRILGNYGMLKVSESDYEKLEKQYLTAVKKENFGYACLTNEKQYYLDNYPNIVVENSDIDTMILLMLGGK